MTVAQSARAGSGRHTGGVRLRGAWPELRRELEAMAARALPPGQVARVRAAFPFGAGGATVLFESGCREALTDYRADRHRPAAVLETCQGSADFSASLIFPESDPELAPLASLLAGGKGLSVLGGRPVAETALRAYRPRRRAQVELRLAGGNESLFAKVERSQRAWVGKTRRAVLASVLTGELRLPATVAQDPELGVTVAAQAPGRLLATCLAEPEGGTALTRLGRALLELERVLARAPDLQTILSSYGFCDAVADLARFAALLRRLGAEAAPIVDSGIERLEALAPDSRRRAVVHRDLHDGQVVLGEHVLLLDCDQATTGDPALDVGNLLAHLRLRSLQERLGSDWAAARRAFLAGHGAGEDPTWRRAVSSWEAAALLRLAAVYALRPRWTILGPALAGMAHEILDALEVAEKP